jgi:hypothetical protein
MATWLLDGNENANERASCKGDRSEKRKRKRKRGKKYSAMGGSEEKKKSGRKRKTLSEKRCRPHFPCSSPLKNFTSF